MGLKTRLDGRSEDNHSFRIFDNDGHVVAEVSMMDKRGVTLEIETKEDYYIVKPNGWCSDGS